MLPLLWAAAPSQPHNLPLFLMAKLKTGFRGCFPKRLCCRADLASRLVSWSKLALEEKKCRATVDDSGRSMGAIKLDLSHCKVCIALGQVLPLHFSPLRVILPLSLSLY